MSSNRTADALTSDLLDADAGDRLMEFWLRLELLSPRGQDLSPRIQRSSDNRIHAVFQDLEANVEPPWSPSASEHFDEPSDSREDWVHKVFVGVHPLGEIEDAIYEACKVPEYERRVVQSKSSCFVCGVVLDSSGRPFEKTGVVSTFVSALGGYYRVGLIRFGGRLV